jgi:hypothetical protein
MILSRQGAYWLQRIQRLHCITDPDRQHAQNERHRSATTASTTSRPDRASVVAKWGLTHYCKRPIDFDHAQCCPSDVWPLTGVPDEP